MNLSLILLRVMCLKQIKRARHEDVMNWKEMHHTSPKKAPAEAAQGYVYGRVCMTAI